MTKKEIIKLLDLEVGLFKKTEDENSLGELYFTEAQFRKAEYVLKRLEKNVMIYREKIDFLSRLVKSDKRFFVLNENSPIIKNKTIRLPIPLIILWGGTLTENKIYLDEKI